jgi:hypothetical protein
VRDEHACAAGVHPRRRRGRGVHILHLAADIAQLGAEIVDCGHDVRHDAPQDVKRDDDLEVYAMGEDGCTALCVMSQIGR